MARRMRHDVRLDPTAAGGTQSVIRLWDLPGWLRRPGCVQGTALHLPPAGQLVHNTDLRPLTHLCPLEHHLDQVWAHKHVGVAARHLTVVTHRRGKGVQRHTHCAGRQAGGQKGSSTRKDANRSRRTKSAVPESTSSVCAFVDVRACSVTSVACTDTDTCPAGALTNQPGPLVVW